MLLKKCWYRFPLPHLLYMVRLHLCTHLVIPLFLILSSCSFAVRRFFLGIFENWQKSENCIIDFFLWMNCIHTCCLKGAFFVVIKQGNGRRKNIHKKNSKRHAKKKLAGMQNSQNLSLICNCHRAFFYVCFSSEWRRQNYFGRIHTMKTISRIIVIMKSVVSSAAATAKKMCEKAEEWFFIVVSWQFCDFYNELIMRININKKDILRYKFFSAR